MEERGDANVKATHAFVLLMKQTTQHQTKSIVLLVPGPFEKNDHLKNLTSPPPPKFNVDASGKREALFKRPKGSTLNFGEGG